MVTGDSGIFINLDTYFFQKAYLNFKKHLGQQIPAFEFAKI